MVLVLEHVGWYAWAAYHVVYGQLMTPKMAAYNPAA
jgi:hypothetical protein